MSFFDRIKSGTLPEAGRTSRRDSTAEPPSVRGSWLGQTFLRLVRDTRSRDAFPVLSEIYRRGRLNRWSSETPEPTAKDLGVALRVADWAVLEHRNSPVPWVEVFLALFLADENEESRRRMTHSLSEAMHRAPRWSDGWCMLAAHYRSLPADQEYFRAARSACEHALALDERDEWALVEKAMLHNKYGDLSGEKLCYEELIQYFPSNDDYKRAHRELVAIRPGSSTLL